MKPWSEFWRDFWLGPVRCPRKAEDLAELARAWDEHLESTKAIAAGAAKNAEDASKLRAELDRIIARKKAFYGD